MLGAIAGDIIGSIYEHDNIKTTDFDLFYLSSTFTDDTVLSVAIADAILNNRDYSESLRDYGQRYPDAGYGWHFSLWVFSENMGSYNSWGNGSAMRVSPVGFAFYDMTHVLEEAKRTAEITHNHPEGIKGAQATALSIHLAKEGSSKEEIRNYITEYFGYDLDRRLNDIRLYYKFDVSCQGSVPEAIIAFLESSSLEDAIRKAISIGGDSDTIACIAGGIAEAYYKEVPQEIVEGVRERLPADLLSIIDQFEKEYPSYRVV